MILFFPLLGNPDGRIMETLSFSQSPKEQILSALLRYGDIIPNNGTIEFIDNHGNEHQITFTKQSPGAWNLSGDPIGQEILPGM